MNYSEIIAALNHATGFDLFRINVAIGKMLDDPQRSIELKRNLRQGQQIEYFDPAENRAISAVIIEFKRTRASVRNVDDGRVWNIPYYYININAIDTTISGSANKQGLDRNEVKIGDKVGFIDKNNVERYGDIVRLNQKTVTLNCDGGKWRVSYSFLFKVLGIDVEALPMPDHLA